MRKKKENLSEAEFEPNDMPVETRTDTVIPGPSEVMSEMDSVLEAEAESTSEEVPVIPSELNLLPLRDAVIYPMLIAPLSVGREPSIQLIDDSISADHRVIGIVTQKNPQVDEPKADDVYDIGCAVIIRTLMKMPEATRLIVQGVQRFRILEILQERPYLRARVEVISEPEIPADKAEEIEAMRRTIVAMFEQAVRLSPFMPDELRGLTSTVQDPLVTVDLVAAHMGLPIADKQRVLSTIPALDRCRALLEVLAREVRVLELSSKVHSEVTAELSRSQRDYYLREQLKAIQRELGEGEDVGDDISDLRERIEDSNMPAEARKIADRELDRLQRINPGSPEYTVSRTYLDTLASMPWEQSTVDNLDLKHVKTVLDSEHHGLDKIKERIIEFLAVRKMRADGRVRQPIICFAGPPGVGKTSLARSIATAMGRKFVRISLGGMRDEAEIRGHRRTYIGSMPGQIIQALRRIESNNPVFTLDEIDKLGNDFRGDPSSALLEVLDPEQNNTFKDHYLDTPFDLSNVFFIATANQLDTIPPALRDRMEVIELAGYTEEEKYQIAVRHLIPKQIAEHGLSKGKIQFEEGAIRHLIQHYTREAGVRNLEREIASVTRKITRMFAEGRKTKVIVTKKTVESALGAPKFLHEEIGSRELTPGTAVGLAWTPVGGDVLFIESAKFAGTKGLVLTGQLGDVMKESVSAALSYLRANAAPLGIEPDAFDHTEIHVHVPAGAVPKDGPSAGVTMLSALASLFTNRKIVDRLAMTGELTLSGQVLPVGGIKEKVLAAQRAGVTKLILPFENKKDYLEEVPAEIRSQLSVEFVKHAREVLEIALAKTSAR